MIESDDTDNTVNDGEGPLGVTAEELAAMRGHPEAREVLFDPGGTRSKSRRLSRPHGATTTLLGAWWTSDVFDATSN